MTFYFVYTQVVKNALVQEEFKDAIRIAYWSSENKYKLTE